MCEAVYYDSPYSRELEATVTAVEAYGKHWTVELDRTIFYPEGGGQPGDTGWIDSTRIISTVKKEGRILHVTPEEPPLSAGTRVHLQLDWDHRYDYMQQHTGQHLISGAFYEVLNIGTVSVRQGSEYTTIDIDRKSIGEEELQLVEQRVNTLIREDHRVSFREVNEPEATQLNMRREPKVSGTIRVVEIEGCDLVACGGVHLQRTGEVQLVHCTGSESIREQVRTVWHIGERALEDYRMKDTVVRALVELYSAKPNEVFEQATAKIEQIRELQAALSTSENQLASHMIERALDEGDGHIITLDVSDTNSGFLKRLLHELPKHRPTALCAVQMVDEHSLHWLISISPEMMSDFSPIREKLFPIIGAKGGGKPPVWQGAGTKPANRKLFLDEFAKLLSQKEQPS
ncbi:MAG: alanyl-tRNA editing protein [Spirochaetota bacterium]